MIKEYIFFRTDRIGDFLMSSILFKSIKRSDPNSFITVVASKKNYEYIKKIDFIDKVILFPTSYHNKLLFYFSFFLKKFHLICVLDGKKRSIYFTFLTRAKFKFLFTYKNFYKIFLNLFFNKIYLDNDCIDKISEIKNLLNLVNLNFLTDDLNTLNIKKINSRKLPLFSSTNYILLHFDEKWIFNDYIKTYTSIEPIDTDQLNFFLEQLILTQGKDIIITTGYIENKFTKYFKRQFINTLDNLYELKSNNRKIIFFDNLSIFELEKLILNSDTFITCHGAPSHIAASLNKKMIDIVDDSENIFFNKWSSHFRRSLQLRRDKFSILTKKILELSSIII